VTAALACRSCSWFGVYRTDVAHSLAGCPNCGANSLDIRDLDDPAWGQVGGELLAELERPARAREDAQP
jgi:predicted  nucleic acid-binding Zn-ribbon protein